MGLSEAEILQMFSEYAYSPAWLYGLIISFMVASSFGLPIPEEVTLVSAGLVCYMGSRPDIYPPPYEGAIAVNVYWTALVCFLAVLCSDFLVYSLGRNLGTRILEKKFFKKYEQSMDKVTGWTKKYGAWAAGVFRFTPGLRFPGHFACGSLGLSPAKFLAVDGTAALLSVPTQVFLVAFFGQAILENIKQFKIVLFVILGVLAIIWLGKRWYKKRAIV